MISQKVAELKGQDGFTLVELLIAVMLLGLIMLIAGGGLTTGLRVWEGGSVKAERAAELMGVQRLLRKELSALRPIRSARKGQQQVLLLKGTDRSLTFLTSLPDYLGSGGLHRVTYFLERGELKMSWSLYQRETDFVRPSKSKETRTLLTDVASLKFEYFSRSGNGRTGRWSDKSDLFDVLPELIRVKVSFSDDTNGVWPDLVVAPRIDE